MILKINDTDVSNLVQGLKVGYLTLVSDDSGRNANGDTVIDIVNRKKKLYVTFRPMSGAEMQTLLGAIADYVVTVQFRDAKTNASGTITAYHGDVEPEYYWVHDDGVLYKAFTFNFIEL